MKLRKAAHTVYKTQYHIVLVSKYRRKIFTKGVSSYTELILQEIGKFRPDIEFIEIGVDKDHVHMHVVIPPKYAVSEIVNALKINSAKKLKKKFAFLKKIYWGTDSLWSTGFFVSTVGIDENIIRNYVKHQGKEDFGQAELEL